MAAAEPAEPAETGFFRGAGGGIFELPLPLADNYEHQRVRGQLVRVTETGGPYEQDKPASARRPVRPAPAASKNEWVGYAVAVDKNLSIDDADAMTKNDLVEKYGK
jgi:hypothetical protein